jgi:hypothetical protein
MGKGAALLKHKGKTLHRAKMQRRKEKQNQAFVALSCEKPIQAQCEKNFLVLSGKAGKIHGFPTSLDCLFDYFSRRTSLRLCVSAREYCFCGIAKYLCLPRSGTGSRIAGQAWP